MSDERDRPPFIARTTRRFSLFIILAWVALILISTLIAVDGSWRSVIPALEKVGREHSVSVMPKDAPSAQAMKRMGEVFQESDSDSSAMIVLEAQQPLGDEAHRVLRRIGSGVEKRSGACGACAGFVGGSAHLDRASKAPIARPHMFN